MIEVEGKTLVSGDEVFEPEDIFDGGLEPVVGLGSSVGLVAAHHRRPLVVAHRARAGIGQEVDEDILGLEEEEIVTGLEKSQKEFSGWQEATAVGNEDTQFLKEGMRTALSAFSRSSEEMRRMGSVILMRNGSGM